MKTILLVMFRRILAQSILDSIQINKPDFVMRTEYDYPKAVEAAVRQKPDVVLLEIKEGAPPHGEDPYEICTGIRKALPKCAIMLMCPESSVRDRRRTMAAMQAGDIDDYVFYDTSMDYFIAKLETLTDLGLGGGNHALKQG